MLDHAGRSPYATLTESPDFWRSVADSAPDMTLLVDATSKILYANRLPVGICPDTVLGRSAFDYVPAESRDELRASLGDIFKGAPARLREQRGVHDDGSERWYATHTGPVKLNGRVVAAIVVARDITEFRRLRQQVQEWHKMEALGRLAAGIAHDFNNILTVVRTCAQFILDSVQPSRTIREDAAAILVETRRGAALTSQLLCFARLETPPVEAVDLDEVIREIVIATRRVEDRPITIATELGLAGATVTANRSQLEQVVMNLLVNSREAISAIGTITISTSLDGDFVRLTVSDDGCGMSDETRRRVLEPFYTTKASTGGTGLGLSTVFGIIRRAGGSLDMESAPGFGTTIDVRLCRTGRSVDEPFPM